MNNLTLAFYCGDDKKLSKRIQKRAHELGYLWTGETEPTIEQDLVAVCLETDGTISLFLDKYNYRQYMDDNDDIIEGSLYTLFETDEYRYEKLFEIGGYSVTKKGDGISVGCTDVSRDDILKVCELVGIKLKDSTIKEGDEVVITGNTSPRHQFDIGTKCIVMSVATPNSSPVLKGFLNIDNVITTQHVNPNDFVKI